MGLGEAQHSFIKQKAEVQMHLRFLHPPSGVHVKIILAGGGDRIHHLDERHGLLLHGVHGLFDHSRVISGLKLETAHAHAGGGNAV